MPFVTVIGGALLMFFVLRYVYGDAAISHLEGGCFSLTSLRGALLMSLVLQYVYGDVAISHLKGGFFSLPSL
jgi:hypothetical protein